MRRLLLIALFVLVTASPALAARSLVVQVSGMDCDGCNKGVSAALNNLSFLDGVNASFVAEGACGELTGDLDEGQVRAALEGAGKGLIELAVVEECPQDLVGTLPEPWEGRTEGLDVVTISRGEEVDIIAALAPGKYTVVDFGAAWCGPCHEAAETLASYLAAHPDVAVRVVELGGDNPEESYAAPVVQQHLQYVSGIPWFVVYGPGPSGRVLHKGNSADKAIGAVDKHRARIARKKGSG